MWNPWLKVKQTAKLLIYTWHLKYSLVNLLFTYFHLIQSTTVLIPPKAKIMGNFRAKEGLVSPDANKVGDIGSSLFSDLFCGLQLVIYITMTAFSIFSGVTGSLLCLLPADLLAIMVFTIIIISRVILV